MARIQAPPAINRSSLGLTQLRNIRANFKKADQAKTVLVEDKELKLSSIHLIAVDRKINKKEGYSWVELHHQIF